MPNRNEFAIFCDSVTKAYDKKVILGDIDLRVRGNEFVTVVGPSGCGKSTLLRQILGQETPTSCDDFLINGKHVKHPDVTRGIVYQQYSLFPHMSVLDNVLIGPYMHNGVFRFHRDRKKHLAEAMSMLRRVGLAEHAKKKPGKLSGGQRQRVAIVQAVIMKPKILLMDEPFGALDPTTREGLQQFMIELWKETGMTIFFVTHDLEEAFYVGSRIIGLSQYFMEGLIDDIEGNGSHGARIVFDMNVRHLTDRSTGEFGRAMMHLRHDCYDPDSRNKNHVQHLFLDHPDSFATLTDAQRGKVD